MIKFTDPRLYVQGVGTAIMLDPATGDIKFFSDKFQDGNITVSADDGLVSAGIGNAPAIMIPSNPNVQVSVTAADYSEYAKSAAVGGKITAAAPVMVCQTIAATGTSLTLDVSGGTPVAGPGMEDVVCYVQEIGAASPIAQDGAAYALNATTGAITGFTATNGKSYLVQVAYSIADEETYNREFALFNKLDQSIRKIIITNDDIDYSTSTVQHIMLKDFLGMNDLEG